MKSATVTHVSTQIEYVKDGNQFTPTANEKQDWTMFGLPSGVQRNRTVVGGILITAKP